jgi:hypothetical protein
MRRILSAVLSSVLMAGTAVAVDLPNSASGSFLGGSASSAWRPYTGSEWFPGGNHWRGHHSMAWRERNPDHVFATPGWGGPWSYSPRSYYPVHQPEIAMPYPVAPQGASGLPEPWTQQWYAYCSSRFQSFEPDTGLYTTYSGDKRMCW